MATWSRLRGICYQLVAQWAIWRRRIDSQRGLSQSTENAILLTGAVAVALVVVGVVTNYVNQKLGVLK